MDACMRWPIFGSFAKSVKKPSRDDSALSACLLGDNRSLCSDLLKDLLVADFVVDVVNHMSQTSDK